MMLISVSDDFQNVELFKANKIDSTVYSVTMSFKIVPFSAAFGFIVHVFATIVTVTSHFFVFNQLITRGTCFVLQSFDRLLNLKDLIIDSESDLAIAKLEELWDYFVWILTVMGRTIHLVRNVV